MHSALQREDDYSESDTESASSLRGEEGSVRGRHLGGCRNRRDGDVDGRGCQKSFYAISICSGEIPSIFTLRV
jgi:hypothetical protein